MITFTELAAELGIKQTYRQTQDPTEALKDFSGPIADEARAADTEEISDEDADIIREAWAIGEAQEADNA